MQTTVITPANLRVSRIGLGCVTVGREIDEAAALRIFDSAFERGIDFFDTASAYSRGALESIIARWLALARPQADSVTIATKILPPYESARIIETVGASLQRLGLAAVDLFFLHRWDATAELPDALAALDALVRAGKVRALGASNHNRLQLETVLALLHPDPGQSGRRARTGEKVHFPFNSVPASDGAERILSVSIFPLAETWPEW
jgi:aryl-alcohol dehydrogenase-like predicted oxidoreductase